ncbi:MAG: NupC/NupG family nucleoside CNT transporter [Deltaproteobacteria bacterium]|nr:NupC/NupG family nucleoside CNT transporter [Deltaproteobacteria bacterium]MCB9788383.1 NupC/NupG family nucleoside CNT transporter [Deltaproteobacteria bacterium]
MERLFSALGLVGLVLVAWLLSTDRRAVRWRPVLWGVALQLMLGVVILLPDAGQLLFQGVDTGVHRLLSFSEAGSDFLFQTIEPHEITVLRDGGRETATYIGHISPPLKTLAFWVLPTVVFFSALMAVLYHYGLMQWVVAIFGRIMQRTMGTSGAESLSAAANIFVGQTEAPLVIRPFVGAMTRSELNAVMVGGFATIAGGVMAIYVGVLGHIPGIAGHLVIASIMSAPAALAVAKVMVPETGVPATMGRTEMRLERPDVNGIDALSRGTLEGLQLALNIGAMLLVFVAVIAMVNAMLGFLGSLVGLDLTLQALFGWLFSPLALLMGIPWSEARVVGTLLGEKIVLTELIAFLHLGELQSSAAALSPRSAVITSYALCGFANFASIGIQIGGIGGIAPERRHDLARLGLRAMIGGTLAAMMTGAVAGLMFVDG